jgi:predicted anti-sigma-YlaC factor YlaD
VRCTQAKKLSSRTLDGELGGRVEAAYRKHLGGCPSCRAHRSELEALHLQLSGLEAPAPPDDLAAAILRAADRRTAAPERALKTGPAWLLWPAGAAAAVAAVLLGYVAGTSIGAAPDLAPTEATAQGASAPELSLEEPFTLLPDSEETLILLAFNGDEVGP